MLITTDMFDFSPYNEHPQLQATLTMPRKKDVSDAVFSFEVIAALIAASGVNVSTPHYKLMAKVDPSRTASGYEHLFRAAKARAKEIAEMEANGEIEGAATKAPAKRNTTTANDGGSKAEAGTKLGRWSLHRNASGSY
jgi:hypothetical protein